MAEDTAVLDAPATGTDAPAAAPTATPAPRPAIAAKPDKGGYVWGTGRRKSAVARVRVKAGSGRFLINEREIDAYFTEERDRAAVRDVLATTKTAGGVDVVVNAQGGGYMGQAGAVVQGLARALMKYDPTLEPILREHGYLTRDAREVERKKAGQPGARRRFQFSKR